LVLLTLFGCSAESKSDRLKKEIETVNSWTATARMVVESWTRETVSTTYAKQRSTKTQQELAKEQETVSKNFSGQPQLTKQIQQLERIVQQMSSAIEHKNKTAIIEEIQQLDATQQQLARIIKAQGGART
jgi:outer membrane murein-binding lipoprotein Lpp